MRAEKFTEARRAFLRQSGRASLGLWMDRVVPRCATASPIAQIRLCADELLRGGTRLDVLQLDELEAPDVPMHRTVGRGLDARLFTDLSTISPDDTPLTPADRFFVRSTIPSAARDRREWTLDVAGLVTRPRTIAIEELHRLAGSTGSCVIECAGNARSARFGLLSAARWTGVPMPALFDLVSPSPSARVLVTGIDEEHASAVTSVPGASWIFTPDQLRGAFLATEMNGAPLTADHGAPVRLVVPGWYGCACIKWVTAVTFVDEAAAATAQMREFAARTHQRGIPPLARDYEPATMDFAAMPVRVERWRVDGRLVHLIVGIMWGGNGAAPPLLIRCNPRESFVPVNGLNGGGGSCAGARPAARGESWAVWTHAWRPDAPGRYQIVLRSADSAVRTRRLDLYFYTRIARINDV